MMWKKEKKAQQQPVFLAWVILDISDSKVPGANMAPIWGRQDPCGPHVGPMNFVISTGLVIAL